MSVLSTRTTLHWRLSSFVGWVKPDPKKREHVRERANLIRKNISNKAEEDGLIVNSMPEAGSFTTHTGLRRHYRGESEVEGQDVDIPFVLDLESVKDRGLNDLLNLFEKYANASYPQCTIEKTKSSIKVKFSDFTNFDIVPMIAPGNKKQQIIIRSNGDKVKTSVQKHNDFIKSRSASSKQEKGRVKFNECVRLLKWWREFRSYNSFYLNGDDSPSSFLVNLLCAKAYDNLSVEDTYAETLAKWCGFIANVIRKREAVLFHDYSNPQINNTSIWSVIDPVNPENNIVKKITTSQLNELADWFENAYDEWSAVIQHDIDGEDSKALECLVNLFGNPFKNHCD